MQITRRHLGALLPALTAFQANAQKPRLATRAYRYEDLPVRVNGDNRSRAIFDGTTRTGFGIEIHETELAPGLAPHASHHHVHDEMLILREGALEVMIDGRSERINAGSVVFLASNVEHGWRNVGDTRARYFVMALGRETA